MIKKFTFSLIVFLISFSLFAQQNYNEAIRQGDAALRNGQFRTAIGKYLLAREFEPDKRREIQSKLDNVYDRIEATQQTTQRELTQTKANLSTKQNELDQTKNKLTQLEQRYKQMVDSLNNVNAVKSDKLQEPETTAVEPTKNKPQPSELEKLQKEFIDLVPKITKNNPKKIWKSLEIPKKESKNNDTYMLSIVTAFEKADIEDKKEMIKIINRKLKK